MPLWNLWLDMAKDSLAGGVVIAERHPRIAAGRFYYAAFQAITAVIHYHGGLQPSAPEGVAWEHWGHDKTPTVLMTHLASLLDDSERRRLSSYLRETYKLRLYADYVGANFITKSELGKQRRRAGYVVKVAEPICADGRGRE